MAPLHLFVALPSEARPLIDHYRLKLSPDKPYRTYHSEHLQLTETGTGKLNAACACASALTTRRTQHSGNIACINTGIAGGPFPVGSTWLAHSIVDVATNRRWYPQLSALGNTPTASLSTLDRPSTDYQPQVLYDMEASGVVTAALRFTTLELIHSLKVVSDNSYSTIETLSRERVTELVGSALPVLDDLIHRLHKLTSLLPDSTPVDSLIDQLREHCRFSVSQQHQLRDLLQKVMARHDSLPEPRSLRHYDNYAALTLHLQQLARGRDRTVRSGA